MANIPLVNSSVFAENVEIVLGPINGKVYVRPLQDGTPYSNDSIDQLIDRMHEVAKAEKAFMGVFAPALKEKLKTDKFTSKQLLEYAEKPKRSGLYFMDTPFYTPISFTGLMSAGCHVNLFGMGSFNPSSNSIVPTIRICSNPKTIKRWGNNIDVDLSYYFKKGNLEKAYEKLKNNFIKIVKGKLTISEKENSGEIILPTSSFPL